MNLQGQFSFDAAPGQDGYSKWVAARKLAAAALAKRVGLPLGHQVEVWLRGNIRLRGLLVLREEKLFLEQEQLRSLELAVGRTPFVYGEMDSCVRLD